MAEEIAQYLGSDLCAIAPTHRQAWWSSRLGLGPVARLGATRSARASCKSRAWCSRLPARGDRCARAAIPTNIWKLGAVSAITTLTGSALLALALAHGALDSATAWAAAHVDEDWQMSQWGRDELAMARRAYRFAEFEAAATVLKLTPSSWGESAIARASKDDRH